MQTGISIAAAADKERQLADWLSARGPVAIGFSGGVDSAYLTEVAVETLGSHRVLAVIGRSPSFPQSQWAAARQVAGHIGVEVLEVATNELADPRYAAN